MKATLTPRFLTHTLSETIGISKMTIDLTVGYLGLYFRFSPITSFFCLLIALLSNNMIEIGMGFWIRSLIVALLLTSCVASHMLFNLS